MAMYLVKKGKIQLHYIYSLNTMASIGTNLVSFDSHTLLIKNTKIRKRDLFMV